MRLQGYDDEEMIITHSVPVVVAVLGRFIQYCSLSRRLNGYHDAPSITLMLPFELI